MVENIEHDFEDLSVLCKCDDWQLHVKGLVLGELF